MKKLILFFIILFTGAMLSSGTASDSCFSAAFTKDTAGRPLPTMPRYPTGDSAMMEFIYNHLEIPASFADAHVVGYTVVKVTIDENGDVDKDVKVARTLVAEFDSAVVKAVRMLPKFVPGYINGVPTAMKYIINVKFLPRESFYILPDVVVENPVVPAQFPGGNSDMLMFMTRYFNEHIPGCEHLAGSVMVRFLVDENGDIKMAHVLRSSSPEMTIAGIGAVQAMPRFIPARNDGKCVASWYTIPFTIN